MSEPEQPSRSAPETSAKGSRQKKLVTEGQPSTSTKWKATPETETADTEGLGNDDSDRASQANSTGIALKTNSQDKKRDGRQGTSQQTVAAASFSTDTSKGATMKGTASTTTKSTMRLEAIICDPRLTKSVNPPTIKVDGELLDLNSVRSLSTNDTFFRRESGGSYGDGVLKFTGFDSEEIKYLSKRFRKLDTNSDGMITQEEFMSIPELQTNPLVSRIIEIFDTDKTGTINFREFVNGMSLFSENSQEQRMGILKFAFRIYDMDNDGFISNGELFQVLKLMVADNLTDTELQQIVDKTILYADEDNDQKISFQEFVNVTGGIGYEQKLVLMNL
jgi:Ca2+-binding EF-hand superfamily protein